MSDMEIIKALECCIGDKDGKDCVCCPLYAIDECQDNLNIAVLDLIDDQKAELIKEQNKNSKLRNERNRLKAEIDRLRDVVEKTDNAYYRKVDEVRTAKANAITEFAENAKEELYEWVGADNSIPFYRIKKVIDTLVKEMVGDNNG